ncbi:proteoglycan 4b [Pholidichthys leucotaenia]
MSSTVLCVVILVTCALNVNVAQTTCKGRCGAEYYRGYMCQCDYNCLAYDECCRDYESQCTTKSSCKGRCGETFKRGRLCSCDSDCVKYNQCCSDYMNHCDEEEQISGAASPSAPVKTSSCHNVNDNKPEEPTLKQATDPDSEGNNEDIFGQIFPTDEPSNNGGDGLDDSPTLETSNGYETSTAEFPVQVSTKPTLGMEMTRLDELLTFYTTAPEAPTEISDADDLPSSPDLETASPEAITADETSQSTSTFIPTIMHDTSTSIKKPETSGQVETLPEETVSPSDEPEVSTVPFTAQDSATLDTTAITAESTSVPGFPRTSLEDVTTILPPPLVDLGDPSTSASPEQSLTLTTLIPSTTAAVQDSTTENVSPAVTSADQLQVTLNPTSPPTPESTSAPMDKPDLPKSEHDDPTPRPEAKPWNTDDAKDYQADDSNDTNLCSGRPVGGATTLRNGTIVVFRGHYFWFLDRNRVPGPAQGITQVWSVPSPIDTVFTRCNCQGKTYIFKGKRYWRFENDVLDPGYPKVITAGFDGLKGHVTAALSVPQYQKRKESVYFFKRGGHVQKYAYQFGTSPTCGRQVQQYAIYTAHSRVVRQAASVLEPAINIRTSWKGFPTTITAAVSIPSPREPEGYKYFVFSRTKSYNVRMDDERPVIAAPRLTPSSQTELFKCPKTVL